MYNGITLTNVVNCLIEVKLHKVALTISILICITTYLTICFHVYTMEEEKRRLCPYDNKRYLHADLPDGRSNPNTYSYYHRDMAEEKHVVADQLSLTRSSSSETAKSESPRNRPS